MKIAQNPLFAPITVKIETAEEARSNLARMLICYAAASPTLTPNASGMALSQPMVPSI